MVCDQSDAEADLHFRGQVYSCLFHFVRFDFALQLESLHETLPAFSEKCFGEDFAPWFGSAGAHVTRSTDHADPYLTPRLCDAIFDRFKEDFDLLGYDRDLGGSMRPPGTSGTCEQVLRDRLALPPGKGASKRAAADAPSIGETTARPPHRRLAAPPRTPDPDRPLTSLRVEGCTLAPMQAPAKGGTGFRAGVFDADGKVVEKALLVRHYGQVQHAGDSNADFPRDDREVIYAGPLSGHYGHFILESLARLWITAEDRHTPLVWSYWKDAASPKFEPWQKEILEVLGVENEHILLTLATRFSSVIVPDVGYRIQDFFHPQHAAFLQGGARHPGQGTQKIWLSRSKYGSSKTYVSRYAGLERHLARHGWEILYPEGMTVREQLEHIANAKRIAGEQGSAFHTLALVDNLSDVAVDIFCRDPKRPAARQNRNYITIANVKKFPQTLHVLSTERVIANDGSDLQKISPNFAEHLDRLGEPIMPRNAPAKNTSNSARRINSLAALNDATSYLEVGVADGGTFFGVAIKDKTAVDPNFRFDIRAYQDQDTRFFEMTSDDYFTNYLTRNQKFDIIFLDGLHTFEQTFRDFCALIGSSHDNTIWLIDDVFPSDVFSGVRSHKDAVRFRRMHGKECGQWQGDVFKTIMAIHDFFPNLSFRTFNSGGNRQTVLLRRPREDFRPLHNNLETISRCDYFYLVDNPEVFNLLPEREVLDWVRGAI